MPGFVKIIADSQNPDGVRLTTFEVSFHLFIWAEVLTHRTKSRNAQSNRAVPSKKVLEMVRTDPALPFYYGKNQSGMAAREELLPEQIEEVKSIIREMAEINCQYVERLVNIGLHKQLANRYIGPYQWIRTLVSATTWENYLSLRDHQDAQPEIAIPTHQMGVLLKEHQPNQLQWGEWHIPFLGAAEKMETSTQLKVSTARAARVSYAAHTGEHSIEKDLTLHNQLLSSGHYSPFEHCAMADEQRRSVSNYDSSWLQYRKVVESNNPYFIL